jgi:hypothetical protein
MAMYMNVEDSTMTDPKYSLFEPFTSPALIRWGAGRGEELRLTTASPGQLCPPPPDKTNCRREEELLGCTSSLMQVARVKPPERPGNAFGDTCAPS